VLADADLRANLARKGRIQVADGFTLDQQADRLVRMLDELVAGGGSGARSPRPVTRHRLGP
jgi:hypothetical protein